MPTTEIAPRSSGMDLGGLTNLASLFLNKDTNITQSGNSTSQNSGGTSSTTATNVSPEAVQAIVQSILSGSNGLASVASQGARSGLYNSSTNQMLINDLIARTAAEGAKLNSSQTTQTQDNRAVTSSDNKTSQTAVPAQIKGSTAAKGLAGLTAFGSLANSAAGKALLSKLGLGANGTPTVNANSGGGASPTEADVKAAMDRGSGFPTDSTPNIDTTTVGAGSQSVGNVAFGNNPSAFVAGDNTQVVNSLTSDMSGAANIDPSGGAGSFISDSINGLDFGSGDVGSAFADAGASVVDDVASNVTGAWGDAGGDWGVDPTTIDYGSAGSDAVSSISDLFDFAEGGLVTPKGNHNLLKKMPQKKNYASGGYVNVQAEQAFSSGGDEFQKSDSGTKSDNGGSGTTGTGNSSNIDFFRKKVSTSTTSAPSEADTYSPNKSLGVRIIDAIQRARGVKGYANGGLVDTTNVGLRITDSSPADSIASTVTGNDQSVSAIRGQANNGQTGSTASQQVNPTKTRGTGSTNTAALRNRAEQEPQSTEGTPGTGVVGDPASNAAAVNGFALGLVSAITGIPVGLVSPIANTLGFTNTPITPVTGIINAITSMAKGDPMADAAATASAANTAPSQSDNNAAMANAIADDTNMDPMDALVGIVSDPGVSPNSVGSGDAPGEGGGVGGSGNSAGDAGSGDGGDGSSGDGSGGDGGTASAATGGKIQGPGTSTSDSIKANLSNGEYVIKAAAVKHFGADFFDMLNNAVETA